MFFSLSSSIKSQIFSPPGPHLAYIFRDRIIKENMWSIFSCSIISWQYTAHWCRLDSCNVPALDHVGLNIVHTVCQQACEHEWAQLKGYFVSTLYWTLLHYRFAIWLPTINKLLRIWKLLSRFWPTWSFLALVNEWTQLHNCHWLLNFRLHEQTGCLAPTTCYVMIQLFIEWIG